MPGLKLSGTALQKIETLTLARRKMDRVHSLIEQYGIVKKGEDTLLGQIARAAQDAQKTFMNAGYGTMADTCNQINMLGKRGGNKPTKLRNYREMVTAVKAAIEHAEKMIIEEETKAHNEQNVL